MKRELETLPFHYIEKLKNPPEQSYREEKLRLGRLRQRLS